MEPLNQLSQMIGKYRGTGTNHEQEEFTGHFSLQSILDGKGVEFSYEAIGNNGTSYHKEKTIIAPDLLGNLKMWNLNSNSPGMTELHLLPTEGNIAFGIGKREDKSTFREEITIEYAENSIGYHYSWGMPGEDFAYRSGLKMERINIDPI